MRTTTNTLILFFAFLLITVNSIAQVDSTSKKNWGNYIFIPSIEMGYLHHNAANLAGSLLIKTSLEYRFNDKNAAFFRLNYDTYNAQYKLTTTNKLTNILQGTAAFTDLLLGAGYRFGNEKLRFFVLAQSGIKFYDYPNALVDGTLVTIEQQNKISPVSRLSVGIEYYISPKSAFSIDLFYNQTWSSNYFWTDQGGAIGISIGFTTALF